MSSARSKSASYQVGYRKPPRNTRFRKGQSGNPGRRPRRPANAWALALQEAYRTVTVEEDGNALALPAIRAILRSQIELATKGNVEAQRAILAAIQTIEEEDAVEASFATDDGRRSGRTARRSPDTRAGCLREHELCRGGAARLLVAWT